MTKIIVISGCSSGLGRTLAACLCAAGHTVFAGLRDPAGTRAPAGTIPLALDVTRPAQIKAAIGEISRRCGRLDVLVNNAGLAAAGPLETTPLAVAKRLFAVNFFGPLALTQQVLPLMRAQKNGQIVAISSLSGLLALPGDGIYAASKHALEAAMESLAFEVRRWNIQVALVEPGSYATRLCENAWRSPPNPAGPYPAPRQASSAGGDSAAAAAEIAALIEHGSAALRHPVGGTARQVFAALGRDDQKARAALIEDWADPCWRE